MKEGLSIPFFSMGRQVYSRTITNGTTFSAPDWVMSVRRTPAGSAANTRPTSVHDEREPRDDAIVVDMDVEEGSTSTPNFAVRETPKRDGSGSTQGIEVWQSYAISIPL